MLLTLVNHASMLIENDEVCVWSDPWLAGTSFNNSWGLLADTPQPTVEYALERATHIYISHEHPDHFHIPSLKQIAKRRPDLPVIVQHLNTKKVSDALRGFGFRQVIEMRHREKLKQGNSTFYLYQVFPLDSAFAVIDGESTVLNLNDTDLSAVDLATLRKDLGKADVVLNQFSLATYDGRKNAAAVTARYKASLVDAFIAEHRALGARVSIPFASFSYFCTEENSALNELRTHVSEVVAQASANQVSTVVLRPGEQWQVGAARDCAAAVQFWDEKTRGNKAVVPATASVTLEELTAAVQEFIKSAREAFTPVPLALIGTLRFYLPDLNRHMKVDFARNQVLWEPAAVEDDYDVKVKSQPLWFAFKHSYGMQTLSISGRLTVGAPVYRFMLLRIICALDNSEFYLSPRKISRDFVSFVGENFTRITAQVLHSFKIVRGFTS